MNGNDRQSSELQCHGKGLCQCDRIQMALTSCCHIPQTQIHLNNTHELTFRPMTDYRDRMKANSINHRTNQRVFPSFRFTSIRFDFIRFSAFDKMVTGDRIRWQWLFVSFVVLNYSSQLRLHRFRCIAMQTTANQKQSNVKKKTRKSFLLVVWSWSCCCLLPMNFPLCHHLIYF